MKILQLDIKGFRSLKEVTWKPGDLNVVIGPNGSGKSNLLRMLELVSVAAQGRLSRHILASRGMGALLWDGHPNAIKYQVKASSSEGLLGEAPASPYFLAYEVELDRFRESGRYHVGHEILKGDFEDIEDISDPRSFKHLERVNDFDGIRDEESEGGLFVQIVRKQGSGTAE